MSDTKRLDEETERLMTDILRQHALVVTSSEIGSLEWKNALDDRRAATDALRSRIRALQDEARKEGRNDVSFAHPDL
jgi:hypothetical protein